MGRVLLVMVVIAVIAAVAWAQERVVVVEEPAKTSVEQLEERVGVVVVKGVTEVGEIAVSRGERVTVLACEVRELEGAEAARGVVVLVEAGDGVVERAVVDEGELAGLLKGLEAVAGANEGVTKLDEFEVGIRTVGGLRVATYSSREVQGGIGGVVEAGHVEPVGVRLTLRQVVQLRELIEKARGMLGGE